MLSKLISVFRMAKPSSRRSKNTNESTRLISKAPPRNLRSKNQSKNQSKSQSKSRNRNSHHGSPKKEDVGLIAASQDDYFQKDFQKEDVATASKAQDDYFQKLVEWRKSFHDWEHPLDTDFHLLV